MVGASRAFCKYINRPEADLSILKNIVSITNIPQILKTGQVLKLVKDELKRKRPADKR